MEPDIGQTGKLLVSRERSRSKHLEKCPIDGTPFENIERAVRVTHQTGHVRTPSLSPTGTETAYVSDMAAMANCGWRRPPARPGAKSRSRSTRR